MVDQTQDLLRLSGLKQTLQRRLVLRALEGASVHMTVDEISATVERDTSVAVNRSTVYRILEALTEADMVRSTRIGRAAYFELERQHDMHHHLACSQCGTTLHLEVPDLDEFVRTRSAEFGFKVDRIDLVIRGLCPSCQSSGVK